MPFAGFEDFDACVIAQVGKGHDEETARRICGKLQAMTDTRVERFDRGTRIDKTTPTAGGGIRVDAALTRTGVLLYKLGDGSTRREWRPPEDVYDVASLASLRGAPVTDLHPDEPVTGATWRALAVGHVGDDVRDESPFVAASIIVQDAGAVAKVADGSRVELSCGYSCGLEMSAGVTPDGEHYDAIQRGILYNHVALLPRGEGRAGKSVALRLDAGECIPTPMTVHKIDAIEFEAGTPAHLAAVDKAIGTSLARALAAEKRADAAEAALTEAKDPSVIRKAAAARANLLGWAARLDAGRFDEATDDDAILTAIAKKALPGVDVAKLMLSHEQLMILVAQVVGAEGAAPEKESTEGGAPPPAAPGAGGTPADSITAIRDLPPNPANIAAQKSDADELAARRESHAKKQLDRWKTKA